MEVEILKKAKKRKKAPSMIRIGIPISERAMSRFKDGAPKYSLQHKQIISEIRPLLEAAIFKYAVIDDTTDTQGT